MMIMNKEKVEEDEEKEEKEKYKEKRRGLWWNRNRWREGG